MFNLRNVFPKELLDYLAQYGIVREFNSLHGLSQNQIWRICFSEYCFVIKVNASEAQFYDCAAPHLLNVSIPKLITNIEVDGVHWLVMEFLPEQFPRERWLADPDVMAILFNLHQTSLEAIHCDSLFQPRWDDAMTDKMLSFFSGDTSMAMKSSLQGLKEQAQSLFEPQCYISGDPNPKNWGIRADGTLALFDWERFGKGTPALDLGITVPGLGQVADFEQVASTYAGELSPQALALAKLWTVVEIFANAYEGELGNTDIIDALIEIVPAWVETIAGYCG